MYAPEVTCNATNGTAAAGGGGAPSADALVLVGARVRPFTVEAVSGALGQMTPSQRKKLVEGIAKNVDTWASRARAMPKPIAQTVFGPFCPNATDATVATAGGGAAVNGGGNSTAGGSLGKGDGLSAQLRTMAMAAAVDALKPLHVLEAIIGAERTGAAAAKVCAALAEPPLTAAQRVRGLVKSATAPLRRLLPGR